MVLGSKTLLFSKTFMFLIVKILMKDNLYDELKINKNTYIFLCFFIVVDFHF